MNATATIAPLKVFIIYAHEDKSVRDKLLRQLRPLADNGEIDLWSDHEIKPGALWDDEIRTRLEQSELILLIVSDDFFASDYIRNVELRAAFERHARGGCRLVPVIARHCGWEDVPALARLQVLPPGGQPIVSKEWDSADEPYRKTYEGVKTVVRQLLRAKTAPAAAAARPPGPVQNRKRIAAMSLGLLAILGILGTYWYVSMDAGAGQQKEAAKDSSLVISKPQPTSMLGPGSLPDSSAGDSSGATDTRGRVTEPAQGAGSRQEEKQESARLLQKNQDYTTREKTRSTTIRPAEKPVFDRRLPASEGMARVIKDRKQGFLNITTGKFIGWYDDAENFHNGRAYVKQNGRYFWIDKSGKCVEGCD